MSERGYCSRRKAEEYIAAGGVRADGRAVGVGDSADENAVITVDGVRIGGKTPLRYIKLYKPRGYTVSLKDGHNDKLVTSLLKGVNERLFPVGRLDKNSEGLLIMTNDGDFANAVTHPKNGVVKSYRVTVKGSVPEDKVALMEAGVEIPNTSEGFTHRPGMAETVTTAPCKIDIVTREESRTVLVFRISEGKNRQIRRMCEAVGITVSRLKRTEISAKGGAVKLGMLRPGSFEELTETEVQILLGKKPKK